MANASIYAAFERMWQHVVSAFASKADVEELQAKVGDKPVATQIEEYVNESILGGAW